VLIALAVSLVAVAAVKGGAPFARRWLLREQAIAAQAERLARLRGLVSAHADLEARVRDGEAALELRAQRLLPDRTAALAASSLQAALQEFADRSRLSVLRLDVAGAPALEGERPMIPATLSAVGDIYGLTDMLALIQHGPLLLEVTELSVRPNSALRGELLQVTVALRGAWVGG
jgi:hypothetical protein